MSIYSRLHVVGGFFVAALAGGILSGCTRATPAAAPPSTGAFTPGAPHGANSHSISTATVVFTNPLESARVRPKPTDEAFAALLTALPADREPGAANAATDQRPVGGAPLAVAQGRVLVGGQSSAELGAKLRWQATASGVLSTEFGISAPGALALRVGLLIEALPDTAALRFFSPTSDIEHVWTGAQVKAALQSLSQTQAGVLGQFWTPQIAGERVVVAIDLPVGIQSSAVRLSAPRVSSFFSVP